MTAVSVSLTDTHCHLNLAVFTDDLDAVIRRANQSGVRRILIPGLDLESSRKAVEIASQYDDVYAAVGVHPHNASSWSNASVEPLRNLSTQPKVVAIGEIGLDFYRDLSPREEQIEAFKTQLDIARELDLPVVIHNREAIESILEITQIWASGNPRNSHLGVMHAFSSDTESAFTAIDNGFMIGIAGPITFLNAHDRRSITAELPLEKLLIETDSPYLTPHPDRGKRNEPSKVRLIAESVAEIFDLDLPFVAEYTTQNASQLFHWSDERENN